MLEPTCAYGTGHCTLFMMLLQAGKIKSTSIRKASYIAILCGSTACIVLRCVNLVFRWPLHTTGELTSVDVCGVLGCSCSLCGTATIRAQPCSNTGSGATADVDGAATRRCVASLKSLALIQSGRLTSARGMMQMKRPH